jgi:predicted glycoside hydrolase/deacetylase ChbG (UPF0249 family)
MIERYLIVNADDFGQSEGINRGVIVAHEQGIVTSASLMVRWDAAKEAVNYARAHRGLSLGLHVDLGEWVYRDGQWSALYQVVATNNAKAVETEVTRQLDLFCQWMGKPPTHLDSHQHVHRGEPICSILSQIAAELRVPLRGFYSFIHHDGRFYGQDGRGTLLPELISTERLLEIIHCLPAGITELGCHRGLGQDVRSMYLHERTLEIRALCDPSILEALDAQNVELVSFDDIPCLLSELLC